MVIATSLRDSICSLFEVHQDEQGVQRVVTPIEYPGTGDNVVIRIRPEGGGRFSIDENGEAVLYSTLNGGDVESDAVARWIEEISTYSPVKFTEDETLSALVSDERLIAPYIFRVAEAAQQLYAIATARPDRQTSDFKERVKQIIAEVSKEVQIPFKSDVELPIAGGLKADHVIETKKPIIIIAATSATRLLEAEVIYMQYRQDRMDGYILAVAESQLAVGKKQFERAGYYTSKAVVFDSTAFSKLISNTVPSLN